MGKSLKIPEKCHEKVMRKSCESPGLQYAGLLYIASKVWDNFFVILLPLASGCFSVRLSRLTIWISPSQSYLIRLHFFFSPVVTSSEQPALCTTNKYLALLKNPSRNSTNIRGTIWASNNYFNPIQLPCNCSSNLYNKKWILATPKQFILV